MAGGKPISPFSVVTYLHYCRKLQLLKWAKPLIDVKQFNTTGVLGRGMPLSQGPFLPEAHGAENPPSPCGTASIKPSYACRPLYSNLRADEPGGRKQRTYTLRLRNRNCLSTKYSCYQHMGAGFEGIALTLSLCISFTKGIPCLNFITLTNRFPPCCPG